MDPRVLIMCLTSAVRPSNIYRVRFTSAVGVAPTGRRHSQRIQLLALPGFGLSSNLIISGLLSFAHFISSGRGLCCDHGMGAQSPQMWVFPVIQSLGGSTSNPDSARACRLHSLTAFITEIGKINVKFYKCTHLLQFNNSYAP